MIFIGDIHGDFTFYDRLTSQVPESVQIGDFGLGFGGFEPELTNPNHRFIRGNHDNPARCREVSTFIEDGTVEDTVHGPIMYVGGAWSIDYSYRKPMIDWWPDEEVSLAQAEKIFETYQRVKPVIMATHDMPREASRIVFNIAEDRLYRNTTNMLFDAMMAAHQPKLWLHGHWHHQYSQIIDSCQFVGIGINQYVEVKL